MTTPVKNYHALKEKIADEAFKCGRDPKEITLIAVSKNQPWEKVYPLYQGGCRDFGESRIQEFLIKEEQAPRDLNWHMIGPLQKNKVKKAIGKFALIHSVDSPELAKTISLHSQVGDLVTPILLQVNTSGELSKQGLSPKEWRQAFEEVLMLEGVSVQGLMTMAPFTQDNKEIHACFSRLRQFREELLPYLDNKTTPFHLSMGMSHDYVIAIQEGATLLRIGSALFDLKTTQKALDL